MRARPLLDSGASLAALERDALAELRPKEAEVPDVHRALHLRVEEEHVVARARRAQPRVERALQPGAATAPAACAAAAAASTLEAAALAAAHRPAGRAPS